MDTEMIDGQYAVEKILGSGTYGTVYKVFDKKSNRFLALKQIKKEIVGDHKKKEIVDRLFKKEVEALEKCSHPNIIKIYNIDLEKLYFTMDYIEGKNLEEYLEEYTKEKGKISIKKKVEWIKTLANALDHIHSHRIIHRDIKNTNILVKDEENYIDGKLNICQKLYIVDLGIALFQDMKKLTKTASLGSPLYMSPEQQEGKDINCQTDIWGLGIIFYWLLTGRLPFRDIADIKKAELPSIRKYNKFVDKKLESICVKALEKDQSFRYQTMKEMIEDLDAYQKGKPLIHAGSWTKYFHYKAKYAPIAICVFIIALLFVGYYEYHELLIKESQILLEKAREVEGMGKENLNLKLSFLTQAKKIIENPIIGRPQSKLAKYNKIENSIKAHEFFVTGMLLLLESQEKIILMETIENFFVQAANLAQEDEKLSFQIGDFGFCGIEEILTKKMEDLEKSINNNPSKISEKIKYDTLRSERIKYNQKAIEHFTKKNYDNKYLSMLIYARMGCCYERIGIVFSIETLASVEQKNDRKDMETAFKKSIECFLNALSVCDQLQKEGNNIDPTNIFFNKAFAHEHIAVILHKYNFSLNEVLQHLKAASQTQLECILECAKRKNQTHIDYWNNFKRFHEHLKSFLSNEDENWKKKQLFDSYNFIVSSAEQVLAINPKDLNAKKMLDFWK